MGQGSAAGWSFRLAFAAPLVALSALAVGVAVTSRLHAYPEWSQWRGPLRDGKSLEKGLMKSWPEDGPPLAWRGEGLGRGYASVSVAGGRIFTMGDFDDGQFVLALDEKQGRHLWRTRIGPSWDDEYMGPRATPTVDGRLLYALSTEGILVCLDAATGAVRWRHSLPEEYGGSMMKVSGGHDWRFSESPLVDGDRVVVTPGARDAALVAFHKKTGDEVWRAAIPDLGEHGSDGAGYSSAVISEGGGVRHYVQLLGRGLVGIEAETGRFLWGYNRVANDVANIPTPIASGDYVFAANGYGTGAVLLELVRRGGRIDAREVYFLGANVLENHHGGLILDGGYVYTATGQGQGLPVCLELATGRIAWGPAKNEGRRSAAIAYADGRLYFRYQDGRMILIEATPEGYREHGSFKIPGARRESWPHPVIAGGKLYLREQGSLFTYDVSASS
jgi:outer membrane protein assembly factor BamB